MHFVKDSSIRYRSRLVKPPRTPTVTDGSLHWRDDRPSGAGGAKAPMSKVVSPLGASATVLVGCFAQPVNGPARPSGPCPVPVAVTRTWSRPELPADA